MPRRRQTKYAQLDGILDQTVAQLEVQHGPRGFKISDATEEALANQIPYGVLQSLQDEMVRGLVGERVRGLLTEVDEHGVRVWGCFPDGRQGHVWKRAAEMTLDEYRAWIAILEAHRRGVEREIEVARKILAYAESAGAAKIGDVLEEAAASL